MKQVRFSPTVTVRLYEIGSPVNLGSFKTKKSILKKKALTNKLRPTQFFDGPVDMTRYAFGTPWALTAFSWFKQREENKNNGSP